MNLKHRVESLDKAELVLCAAARRLRECNLASDEEYLVTLARRAS